MSTTTTVHDRLVSWENGIRTQMATEALDLPFATAVITSDLPAVYDLNVMIVTSRVPPALLLRSIDRLAARVGWDHRRIEVQDQAATSQLRQPLRDAGYEEQVLVTMELAGRSPGSPSSPPVPSGGPGHDTAIVEVADQLDLGRAITSQEPWATSKALVDQMLQREVRLAAVAGARVVIAPAATPVSRCLLLTDGLGLVEIDAVTTLAEHRGEGWGEAVVKRAIAEAALRHAEHVVLVADADDWPMGWYERLGFRDVGRSSTFSRVTGAVSADTATAGTP